MGQPSLGGALSVQRVRSLRAVSAIAALCFLGVASVVYENYTPFTLLPVGVALGFGLYAAFGPRESDAFASSLDDPRLPGVLTAAFLLSVAVAMFSLRNAYYTKPTPFYVAIAVAAGVLVLRILLTDAHLTNGLFAFIFGLATFLTNQVVMPLGQNGPDSGFHRRFAQQVYETGLVPGVGGTEPWSTQYIGYPLQHVVSASTAQVTGYPVTPSYRGVAILGMVLVLPLTYLVARRLGSREFALLAVVVVASMEYVVYRVGHPSKLAYALPLLMLTFACAIYIYHRRGGAGVVPLFALFSIALVFTHAHTAFTALILMVALAIGCWLAPIVEPRLARALRFDADGHARGIEADGGESTDRPASSLHRSSGGVPDFETATASRFHVLAFAFVVAFVAQAIYFSDFYGNIVEILLNWVEAILLASESTREAPRFGQLPNESLFVNTIGSGLLVAFVVLGLLDSLERRRTIGFVLTSWLAAAGVLMVLGVVGDAQFALPNRVYVIAQLTAMGFFAAGGLVYLFSQTDRTGPEVARVLAVALVAVVVCFVFFSTASTIAGPGTSPFNDDVPHRIWTGMVEQNAADDFAKGHLDEDLYRSASSYPIDVDGGIDYSSAIPGEVVYVNGYGLSTGTTLQSGPGQIGGAIYAIPREPTAGLVDSSNRIYDNGAVEFYQVRGDQPTSTQSSMASPPSQGVGGVA